MDEIIELDVSDLDLMGIPSDRASQFVSDIQKEIHKFKTRHDLKNKLLEVNCSEYYDVLLQSGLRSEDVLNISHDFVKGLSLTFKEKKTLLKKIKDANTMLEGIFTKFHCLLSQNLYQIYYLK